MKPPPDGPGLVDILAIIISPLIAGVILVACVVGAVVCGLAGGGVRNEGQLDGTLCYLETFQTEVVASQR